jgi:hypothetical protein
VDLQRFKWFLLDEAGAAERLGTAYGPVQTFFPDTSWEQLYEIVRRALLELYDEGLIAFFHASLSDGYNVTTEKLDQTEQLDRAQVVKELEQPEGTEPSDAITFFIETEKGAEVFRQLPPGAVPKLTSWKNPRHAENDDAS